MSVQQVIAKVEQYLNNIHPDGSNLAVVSDGVRQDQNWWYVPVKPDKEPSKRFEYYEALAEVESKLQINDKLIVMFVPVFPDVMLKSN